MLQVKGLTDIEVNRTKVMAETLVEYSAAVLNQQGEIRALKKRNGELEAALDKIIGAQNNAVSDSSGKHS